MGNLFNQNHTYYLIQLILLLLLLLSAVTLVYVIDSSFVHLNRYVVLKIIELTILSLHYLQYSRGCVNLALACFSSTTIHTSGSKKCLHMKMVFLFNWCCRKKSMCKFFACQVSHLLWKMICKGMHIRCNVFYSIKPFHSVNFIFTLRKGCSKILNPFSCINLKFINFLMC